MDDIFNGNTLISLTSERKLTRAKKTIDILDRQLHIIRIGETNIARWIRIG
jgi:hypothetical protein